MASETLERPTTAPTEAAETKTVTPDNFSRAETDLYFSTTVKEDGFGKFHHFREPTAIDKQTVIRMNRDTLYSAAIFDLDAGPVTVTLPESGSRFMSMQLIDEDQYTSQVIYDAGPHVLSRDNIPTRYVMTAIRTLLLDSSDPADLEQVHALQDAIKVEQPGGPGTFEIPDWDKKGQAEIRKALLALGAAMPDSKGAFGARGEVNPVRFLIGSAMAWGGNPEKKAMYINVTPRLNDGRTVHRLTVSDVPVDGFWSISLYNAEGYFQQNDRNAYSVNNLTAAKNPDGSVTVQFGGCEEGIANCLPIMPGWNYIVRLYRPRAEILDGRWKFPEALPVG